jgi:hypothetical protein
MNVTAGPATEARKEDPSGYFRSAALVVFGPNREVCCARVCGVLMDL